MTTRDGARRASAEPRADDLGFDPTSSAAGRERDWGFRDRDDRGADRDRDHERGGGGGSGGRSQAPLPERLYAARERKGVDLYRAERDTKIRARYLAALERGEYGELPGDVYTKGFLRNYAVYLGLDADDV